MAMTMILVAMGANLPFGAGTPRHTLALALAAMPAQKIRVLKVSAFYQTPAWPDPSEPPFVNVVALVETALEPAALLAALHAIEAQYGRLRSRPNAPRTLDLDLIDYEGRVEAGPPVLPHPRAATRAFVLKPLADVAPEWMHPVLHQPLAALLAALPPQDLASVIPLSP